MKIFKRGFTVLSKFYENRKKRGIFSEKSGILQPAKKKIRYHLHGWADGSLKFYKAVVNPLRLLYNKSVRRGCPQAKRMDIFSVYEYNCCTPAKQQTIDLFRNCGTCRITRKSGKSDGKCTVHKQ